MFGFNILIKVSCQSDSICDVLLLACSPQYSSMDQPNPNPSTGYTPGTSAQQGTEYSLGITAMEMLWKNEMFPCCYASNEEYDREISWIAHCRCRAGCESREKAVQEIIMDNDRLSHKVSRGKKLIQAINKIIPLYLFIFVSASFPSFFFPLYYCSYLTFSSSLK